MRTKAGPQGLGKDRSRARASALIVRRSALLFALSAMLFTLCVSAQAQQPKKIPRIGALFPGYPATYSPRTTAFLQGLQELGYVDGKNIMIEWRWAEDKVERLPDLAAELVRFNPEVVITNGTPAINALKNATRTIPIVMAGVGDPVGIGLVASLNRPGGNLTGLSVLAPELSGKRLELLKEVVPGLFRVAVILNPTNSVYRPELQDTQDAARSLRLQTEPILEVTDLNTLGEGFTKLNRDRIRAFLLLTDTIFFSIRSQIVEHAAKSRLPAVYFDSAFPDAGGLMSYGPNIPDLYRRAATYVDKILKGAKPADLPVEQPTKFELVINLKTAKQIGVTIPPNVLARADRVIK
jgi:putative tryptophan/tyrosine transport system substrate-binding protein